MLITNCEVHCTHITLHRLDAAKQLNYLSLLKLLCTNFTSCGNIRVSPIWNKPSHNAGNSLRICDFWLLQTITKTLLHTTNRMDWSCQYFKNSNSGLQIMLLQKYPSHSKCHVYFTITYESVPVIRGPFEKFGDSPYYFELELCGGAVTVSFSKYLPWQAMCWTSTHFS
jgi:hypothetical protein